MANLPLTFTIPSFPSPFNGGPVALAQAFAASLQATISDANLILGKVGGSAPTSNIGPWANGQTWYFWSGTKYVPQIILFGDTNNTITLQASTLTDDRTITFQDQSGVVALLSDVYATQATTILSGSAPVVDFSLSKTFYLGMTSNANITTSKSQPGQKVKLIVSNPSTYTVTWGTQIQWPGGTPPTQTTNGKDLITLQNIGGTVYGKQTANLS